MRIDAQERTQHRGLVLPVVVRVAGTATVAKRNQQASLCSKRQHARVVIIEGLKQL